MRLSAIVSGWYKNRCNRGVRRSVQYSSDHIGAPGVRKPWQAPSISDVPLSSPMVGGFRLDDEPVNEDGDGGGGGGGCIPGEGELFCPS